MQPCSLPIIKHEVRPRKEQTERRHLWYGCSLIQPSFFLNSPLKSLDSRFFLKTELWNWGFTTTPLVLEWKRIGEIELPRWASDFFILIFYFSGSYNGLQEIFSHFHIKKMRHWRGKKPKNTLKPLTSCSNVWVMTGAQSLHYFPLEKRAIA